LFLFITFFFFVLRQKKKRVTKKEKSVSDMNLIKEKINGSFEVNLKVILQLAIA